MQSALQTARAQYSAGSTELRTATVVRRGVDYDPQHNPAKRGDRKHFKLENVFWLRTITGKWVACLRPRGGNKFKPLSLAMCRVLWRGVTVEDIGRNEIIGDGNVVHPFVPPLYLDRLRTKRYKRKQNARQKDAAAGNKRQRSAKEATGAGSAAAPPDGINVAARVPPAIIKQTYMYPPRDFFASRRGDDRGTEGACDNTMLHAILRDYMHRTRDDAAVQKRLTANRRALGAISSVSELQCYPQRLMLLQFYDFFFGDGGDRR